jgi:DNA (cytosine-5)-methyltransferase 1
MQTYKLVTLGAHRGSPRLWITGFFAERAGFQAGAKFEAIKNADHMVLRVSHRGSRRVSSKQAAAGTRKIPIIDLNSRTLLDIFPARCALRLIMRPGEILITAIASVRRRVERTTRLLRRLERGEALAVGTLTSGGGVLDHALKTGLADAGVATRLRWANEIREDLMEQAFAHNEAFDAATIALEGPIQEIAFDESVMARVPHVDVLIAGLPCSGASTPGRTRRRLAVAEAHPLVGHLVVAALAVVPRVNPSALLLESVTNYQRTASAAILRNQLREWGYDIYEREFLGTEWGDLEARRRWCMVALTRGIEFDLETLVPAPHAARALGSVLEPLEAVAHRFSPMAGLKARQARKQAQGDRFLMQVYTGSEPYIHTLTKGITKNRSTDPKIQHPHHPELLRNPTAREHARIKGVPERLIEGLPQTTAHELLGQSICYAPFRALGAHLGNALRRFAAGPRRDAPVAVAGQLVLEGFT